MAPSTKFNLHDTCHSILNTFSFIRISNLKEVFSIFLTLFWFKVLNVLLKMSDCCFGKWYFDLQIHCMFSTFDLSKPCALICSYYMIMFLLKKHGNSCIWLITVYLQYIELLFSRVCLFFINLLGWWCVALEFSFFYIPYFLLNYWPFSCNS